MRKTTLFNPVPKKVLHFAPENIFYEHFSSLPYIDYVPCDKFEKGYAYHPKTKHADITQLPFETNTFDYIICVHVLEHVVDDAKALQE
ncbi:MAG TPA: methyltransferase domain-containing protein, partial [Nitrosopumilaceae archaeon]|nr:methyltransferase domain-containing protein [Nitrosopumilaceae archaeon]